MHREPVHDRSGFFRSELVRLLNSLRRRSDASTEITTSKLLEIAVDRADLRGVVDELVERMQHSVGKIEIDDASPGLRGIFADLNDRFGGLLLRQTANQRLFCHGVAPSRLPNRIILPILTSRWRRNASLLKCKRSMRRRCRASSIWPNLGGSPTTQMRRQRFASHHRVGRSTMLRRIRERADRPPAWTYI